jgi:hypothetical protein
MYFERQAGHQRLRSQPILRAYHKICCIPGLVAQHRGLAKHAPFWHMNRRQPIAASRIISPPPRCANSAHRPLSCQIKAATSPAAGHSGRLFRDQAAPLKDSPGKHHFAVFPMNGDIGGSVVCAEEGACASVPTHGLAKRTPIKAITSATTSTDRLYGSAFAWVLLCGSSLSSSLALFLHMF